MTAYGTASYPPGAAVRGLQGCAAEYRAGAFMKLAWHASEQKKYDQPPISS
jgi:hypothetical protein